MSLKTKKKFKKTFIFLPLNYAQTSTFSNRIIEVITQSPRVKMFCHITFNKQPQFATPFLLEECPQKAG